jgi:hypothetical protein
MTEIEDVEARLRVIAAQVVDRIENDLTDRKGLRHAWDNIEADIAEEIREEWRGFVLEALSTPAPDDPVERIVAWLRARSNWDGQASPSLLAKCIERGDWKLPAPFGHPGGE